MKRVTLIAAIIMLSLALTAEAQPGFGQGRGGGKGFHKGGGMGKYMMKFPGLNFYQKYDEELGLKEEQLDKMEQMDDKFQKDRIANKSKIELAMLDMKKLLDDDKVDKNKILMKQDEIMNMKNAMQKKALEYKMNLFDVLTDEQKAKMDEVRENCRKKGRGKGQGQGRGRRGGGCGSGRF